MLPEGRWTVPGRNAKIIQGREVLVGTWPSWKPACKNNRSSDSKGSGAVLWTTSDSDDTHLSLESGKQEVSMSPFCCKVKKKTVIGVDISTGVRMLRYLTRAILASKPSNID